MKFLLLLIVRIDILISKKVLLRYFYKDRKNILKVVQYSKI